MSSFKNLEVVSLITVVFDLLANLRYTNPGDVIFHSSSHMEGWVCDGIDSDLNMALFDVHDSVLYGLCHLHFLH